MRDKKYVNCCCCYDEHDKYDPFAPDTRRETKLREDAKSHHIWYEIVGPGVIIRSQLSGTSNYAKTEDLFCVSCDYAPHSINRGRRWEKVDHVERILPRQIGEDKLSIVAATLPAARLEWAVFRDTRDLEQSNLYHNRGGIRKYIEVDNEEITVRRAKTNRSFFCSPQSTYSSGPSSKKTTCAPSRSQRAKATAESHTRYAIVQLKPRDSMMVDRSWRGWQQQYGYEFKHKRRPTMRRYNWRFGLQEALDAALHIIDED